MLVLRRCEGQRIVIGNDVAIEIVRIRHGDVQVGITAPKAVKVLREELIDKTTDSGGRGV